MALIEINQLSRVYGTGDNAVVALHPVDLNIDRGAFVCVAGPSGSGKSTLLNLIGAIDTPSSGSLTVDGVEVTGLNRTGRAKFRRRSIGFIFQSFNLLPILSVYENVEYSLLLKGINRQERRERVLTALEWFGLSELRDSFPGRLSGGQQQRVAVARAIAGAPAIILADEPTGSLDTGNGRELPDLFTRLNQERRITFIFSSHDPRVIARAAEVITLQDGKLVQKYGGNMGVPSLQV